MPAGRPGSGIEAGIDTAVNTAIGAAFTDELDKIAAGRRRKKDEENDTVGKALKGAGIGGAVGAGTALGAHAVEHHKKMKIFKSIAPLVKALGPDAHRLFAGAFKPRFVKPVMYRRMLAGGLLGLAPGAILSALT